MNLLDIEKIRRIKLSESDRDIIERALAAYRNIAVYQDRDDDYLEIQDMQIDEIMEKIKD